MLSQKSLDELVCDIFRQDKLSVTMRCMGVLLRNASRSSRSHKSIFLISHQSKLRVVVYNIRNYKQNHCARFWEWHITFWVLILRSFAVSYEISPARCPNFEKSFLCSLNLNLLYIKFSVLLVCFWLRTNFFKMGYRYKILS